MAITSKWYGLAFSSAFSKKIDLTSDTVKVMLVTSSYTFDQDAHQYKSSITNEVTGTGYTAGGATLGSPTLTYTGATNTLAFDGADVSWTSATLTARGAVAYDSTPGTDATRPLLVYVDFGADVPVTSGTLSLTWDAAGICSVVVA
ncbi:hypothetical protein [Nocardia sp. NPDC057030]|uniref:hypothetical protein n=1 Tax=unclassified Nocardia TaxID=2637762 RepID=UPI00363C2742